MRSALHVLVPALVAAALLAFGGPPYARVLAAGSAAVRSARPPPHPPVSVSVEGVTLLVHAEVGSRPVDTGTIAWNLPVLLCLWAWVIRRRWVLLALVALVFVLLHVAVTEIEIEKTMGDGAGWPYAFTRAWFTFGAPMLPAFAVAIAWALGGSRSRG